MHQLAKQIFENARQLIGAHALVGVKQTGEPFRTRPSSF